MIPVHNAGHCIDLLLEKLNKQTLKPVQVVVVDSESGDQTRQIAENRNCKVITINQADFDHGTTRNLAMNEVPSEFAVFLTQDAIPADEYMVEELIKPMQTNPNIAICYGRQLPKDDTAPLERFAREFNYPAQSILKDRGSVDKLGLKAFFCSNSCSAVRCSIFKELGGFKSNVIVNEDMLFAARAISGGYSVYYTADAKVYHSHPYSLSRIFSRYFNIGRFFADNKDILKQAGLKTYGSDMLKTGIKTFWQKRKPYYIAALLVEFGVKAFACKLGWYSRLLYCGKRDRHLKSSQLYLKNQTLGSIKKGGGHI